MAAISQSLRVVSVAVCNSSWSLSRPYSPFSRLFPVTSWIFNNSLGFMLGLKLMIRSRVRGPWKCEHLPKYLISCLISFWLVVAGFFFSFLFFSFSTAGLASGCQYWLDSSVWWNNEPFELIGREFMVGGGWFVVGRKRGWCFKSLVSRVLMGACWLWIVCCYFQSKMY